MLRSQFRHTFTAGMRENCGPSTLRDEYFAAGNVEVQVTSRTFEEIFNGPDDDDAEEFEKPTWAAVVRSGNNGESEEQRKRVKEMELRIRAENIRKANELQEVQERQKQKDLEQSTRQAQVDNQRQAALKEAEKVAKQVTESALADEEQSWGDICDSDLLNAEAGVPTKSVCSKSPEMRQVALTVDLHPAVEAEIELQIRL